MNVSSTVVIHTSFRRSEKEGKLPEIVFGMIGIREHLEDPCHAHDEYQFDVEQAFKT